MHGQLHSSGSVSLEKQSTTIASQATGVNQATEVCNPAYSCACPKPEKIRKVASGMESGIKMGGLMEVDC